MFAFPKCTSPSRPQQWFLSPRLSPHVYAFVPHYSASASTDPHLAFKFPDQHASHALMTRLLLQLNSLCSSYSDQTCCLLGSADCYVTKHSFTLIQWPHPRLCTTPEYLSDKESNSCLVWFDFFMKDFFLLLFLNHGTLILRFPLVQGFQLIILE